MTRRATEPLALLSLAVLLCLAPLNAGGSPDTPPRPVRFRSHVEMVVVQASVTDSSNRHVVGLGREHFKVFENKVEQLISHFSSDEAPLSIGIVLDVSESMTSHLISARESVARFLRQGVPEDEYFLVTFNERAILAQDFTPVTSGIHDQIEWVQAKGYTALYDAIHAGLQKLSQARNPKKALLVVTDGIDNNSRHTFSDLKELAGESDVQIYLIGEGKGEVVLPFFPFPPVGLGRTVIREIAGLTGGRAFFPKGLESMDYYCDLIHSELRSQYRLGYVPANPTRDGKWRKIQVRVSPPKGFSKVVVQARTGYFVRKQR